MFRDSIVKKINRFLSKTDQDSKKNSRNKTASFLIAQYQQNEEIAQKPVAYIFSVAARDSTGCNNHLRLNEPLIVNVLHKAAK